MEKNQKIVHFLKDSEGNQKVETNPGFVKSLLISLKYSSSTKIFYIGLSLLIILTSSYLLFFDAKFKIIGKKTESESTKQRGFSLPTSTITSELTNIPNQPTTVDTQPTQSNTTLNQQNQTQSLQTPTPTKTPTPTIFRDTTPPIFVIGPQKDPVINFDNFCFPMYITDNVKDSQILIQYQFDGGAWSGWTTNYAPCYSNVANGQHTFSVQAKDAAGNTTSVITTTFSVSVIQDITVSLSGQIYNDVNCNNTKDSGENGVSGISITIMYPTGLVLSTITVDGNGYYNYSKTIKENETLTIVPDPLDHNNVYRPPSITLNSNNKSATINISHVPSEYYSLCPPQY